MCVNPLHNSLTVTPATPFEDVTCLTKEAGSQSHGCTRAVVKGQDGETACTPVASRRIEGTACIL